MKISWFQIMAILRKTWNVWFRDFSTWHYEFTKIYELTNIIATTTITSRFHIPPSCWVDCRTCDTTSYINMHVYSYHHKHDSHHMFGKVHAMKMEFLWYEVKDVAIWYHYISHLFITLQAWYPSHVWQSSCTRMACLWFEVIRCC